jgi:ribosomal protein S27E
MPYIRCPRCNNTDFEYSGDFKFAECVNCGEEFSVCGSCGAINAIRPKNHEYWCREKYDRP